MRVSTGDLRVSVDQRAGQARDGVQQAMLGADGELMGLHGTDAGRDNDLAPGPDLTADPAHPDLPTSRTPGVARTTASA